MDSYKKLDLRIQKWIFKQGWSDLREIQKKTIDPILAGDSDVLISASTAAGKTEAFFLPAMTAIAQQEKGFGIIYLSPLKALINDQYRRLESLSEIMNMPVTPWHGDSSQGLKARARKHPAGILLITPESLEAMLIKRAAWARMAFANIRYIAIDEFHAFIGSERGLQLLSLLNRLEHLIGKSNSPIPRVALSATLGDLETVPKAPRPNNDGVPCAVITNTQGEATIRVQVKGYQDSFFTNLNDNVIQEFFDKKEVDFEGVQESINEKATAEYQICRHIYSLCRSKGSHLVFANSRQRTESIAARLRDFCEDDVVPNEFFPHHGSLSKELREELEARLQKEALPTTAICTMTLELGIDIGKVNSVIQVTAPHSVSSLRQRVGRSGRRGDPSILRMLIAENEIHSKSSVHDRLRLELVQSLATVRLLIANKWFEPADKNQFHFSTLIHQVLAVIAQWGGVRAEQLYNLLCVSGPFQQVSSSQFIAILRHLGSKEFITQLGSGELVLGWLGEKIVNHYTFYAVFSAPEEFRVINNNKTIGQLPIDSMIMPEQHIVFAGRRWRVTDVNVDEKTIQVERTKGGTPPRFGSQGLGMHDIIRQEMLSIYLEEDYRIATNDGKVDFADNVAARLFQEGVNYFKFAQLNQRPMIQYDGNTYIFPWLGDKVVNTLAAILIRTGLSVSHFAGVIEVQKTTVEIVKDRLVAAMHKGLPQEHELSESVPVKNLEKFDSLLPADILNVGYGRRMFDIDGAKEWLESKILS